MISVKCAFKCTSSSGRSAVLSKTWFIPETERQRIDDREYNDWPQLHGIIMRNSKILLFDTRSILSIYVYQHHLQVIEYYILTVVNKEKIFSGIDQAQKNWRELKMANEQKVLTEITQNVMETEQTVNKKKSVAYIFNDEYLKLCSQLPKVENRVRLNCFSGISSNSEISTLSICACMHGTPTHTHPSSGGSKGAPGTRAHPLWVQLLSFSCSFRPKNRLAHPL